MSTNSNIGYQDPITKKFHSIYCHWDGHPSNNGKILKEHYKDLEKIKELIALGNISQLEENVHPSGPHSYDKPEKGVVVAYMRDRAETDQEAQISDTKPTGQEFNYVFDNGTWFVSKGDSRESWALTGKILKDEIPG